jgi:hypothetical protein
MMLACDHAQAAGLPSQSAVVHAQQCNPHLQQTQLQPQLGMPSSTCHGGCAPLAADVNCWLRASSACCVDVQAQQAGTNVAGTLLPGAVSAA